MSVLTLEKVLNISLCNSMTRKQKSLLDCRNPALSAASTCQVSMLGTFWAVSVPRDFSKISLVLIGQCLGKKNGGMLAPPIRINMAALNRTAHSAI